jgi:hypothetical protein
VTRPAAANAREAMMDGGEIAIDVQSDQGAGPPSS